MVRDDASNCCGDSNWSQLGRILLVLVETEKVSVRQIWSHTLTNLFVV